MLLAIDESGDGGKKFWRGSSKWFIVAAVVVKDNAVCGEVCTAVESFVKLHSLQEELHFSHNSDYLRRLFLDAMLEEDFRYVCFAIDKTKLIRSKPWVFRTRLTLYNYAFGGLFDCLKSDLEDATVIMDQNGAPWFERAMNRHLYKRFGSRHKGDRRLIRSIYSQDSSTQPLIQLADYVAGSCHHFVHHYSDADAYVHFLERKGTIYYDHDQEYQNR